MIEKVEIDVKEAKRLIGDAVNIIADEIIKNVEKDVESGNIPKEIELLVIDDLFNRAIIKIIGELFTALYDVVNDMIQKELGE